MIDKLSHQKATTDKIGSQNTLIIGILKPLISPKIWSATQETPIDQESADAILLISGELKFKNTKTKKNKMPTLNDSVTNIWFLNE